MRLLCRLGLHKMQAKTCVDPDFKIRDYTWCDREGCRYYIPFLVNIKDVSRPLREEMERRNYFTRRST